MKLTDRLRSLLASPRGNAAIEFAIVAPIMLLLTGGIVEVGAIFKVYNSVNRLATQYASAWSDCSDFPAGTCGTELANYTDASALVNIAPILVPARLTLVMFQFKMNGTSPSVTYPTSGFTITAAQIARIQSAGFVDKDAGVFVTASYTHQLNFFSAVMGPFLNSALSPSYTVTQLKGTTGG